MKSIHALIFFLDDQRFAIEVNNINTVIRAANVTAIPDPPQLVLGVINIHGKIVPVLDLRARMNLPKSSIEPENRIIIIDTKMPICFFVDSVDEVVTFNTDHFQNSQHIYPSFANFLIGIGKQAGNTVFLIDVNKVFNSLITDKTLEHLLHSSE